MPEKAKPGDSELIQTLLYTLGMQLVACDPIDEERGHDKWDKARVNLIARINRLQGFYLGVKHQPEYL